MSQAAVAGGRDASLVQGYGERAITKGARTPRHTSRQQRRSRRPKATWKSLASEVEPASGRQGVGHEKGRPVRKRSPRRGRTPADASLVPPLASGVAQRTSTGFRVNEIGPPRMTTVNRGSVLAGHPPWSPKSRFSRTARNLSRILGLNDPSSASV